PAISLIDELTTTFAPEQYEDTYRLALMDKIKEKIDHNEGVTPNAGAAAPREDVIDLVSALQASIERTKAPDREAAAKAPVAKGAGEKKKKTSRKKASEAK
ncbi:Ku protein, partial [Bacillus haynesii]|nr:Ku protein [Bacillus haynesii]